MATKTSSTKEITLSLFALTETAENITELIIDALNKAPTVEDRMFELDDDKGTVCAMDVQVSRKIVLMHIARFEKGASIDVIRHTVSDLKKGSLDVEIKKPEKDSDYLKSQAVALFCENGAIAMVSDGREYTLVWSFVHKLLGEAMFVPRQVFSTEIKEAIERHGIQSVRLNGYVVPKSVKKAISNNDMSLLEYCPQDVESQKQKSSVKVALTFTPERNAMEYVANLMYSVFDKSTGTVVDSDDGLFSVVVKTNQKENIKKDGFCRSKKVKFQKNGSFVFKSEAYNELTNWFKELRVNHEWPSE